MDKSEAEFMAITGRSRIDARRFLQMTKGDLEQAVSMSFEETASAPPHGVTDEPAPRAPMPAEWSQPTQKKGGFRSMADMFHDGSEHDDDDTQRYMSTDGRSGRLTIDPKKKKEEAAADDDFMSQLFKKAKGMSEEEMRKGMHDHDDSDGDDDDEHAAPKKKGVPDDWTSSGGVAAGGSSVGGKSAGGTATGGGSVGGGGAGGAGFPPIGLTADGTRGPAAKPKKLNRPLKLTTYKNGFTVDDGPLFPAEDPQTQRDLQTLAAGRVPARIMPPGYEGDISVSLVDRRDQEAPKPPRDYFSEKGNTLTGPSPTVTPTAAPKPGAKPVAKQPATAPPSSTTSSTAPTATPVAAAGPSIASLAGGDSFMVQCRFETGQVQKFMFTTTSTLADLQMKAALFVNARSVELAQPIPRKVFAREDMNKTLLSLGLKNASVMAKPL